MSYFLIAIFVNKYFIMCVYIVCLFVVRWLRICIRANVKAAIPLALKFVSEQGRMKFVRPLYRFVFTDCV